MRSNEQPNILFIMTDEQRFDAWGKTNAKVKTPNLDELAEHSIWFTQAYTTNPSCVPARAAIYTGRYPSQCGAPTFITYANDSETTFMSLLQQAGYHTAVVGKQHFGKSGITRGYDEEDIVDIHSPAALDKEDAPPSSYLDYLRNAGYSSGPELVRKHSAFTQKWLVELRYHVDHYVGERGLEWLRDRRPADRPWFLSVSFPGPHQPFDCLNTKFADLYPDETDLDAPVTEASDLDGKPPHFKAKAEAAGVAGNPLGEAEIRRMRRAYYANISLIDEQIGKLIDTLKETGEYERTMIVFTSDHGDFLGDYGLTYKGQYLSEVLMRVPLIIKPPLPHFQGRQEHAFALNFDIAATCLSVAGATVPERMSCRDLSVYWRSGGCDGGTGTGVTVPDREFVYLEAGDLRGIRTERWKLVHYRGRPYGELYDLAADPWERRNLWDDPERSGVKLELYRLLTEEWIRLGEKSSVPWIVKAPPI